MTSNQKFYLYCTACVSFAGRWGGREVLAFVEIVDKYYYDRWYITPLRSSPADCVATCHERLQTTVILWGRGEMYGFLGPWARYHVIHAGVRC